MNLVIDIGNTYAKAAVFQGETLLHSVHCRADKPTELIDFTETYKKDIGHCIVSSVGQPNAALQEYLSACPFQIVVLNADMPLPFVNLYRTPHTLGSDRAAAVVGAVTCFPKQTVLIIDMGTCVTYDLVDGQGIYRGGNISPGISLRLMTLHEHTARLPLVSEEGEMPEIGMDTDTAIRNGVIRGMQYEVNGYIDDILRQYPDAKIVLTGGKKKLLHIDNRWKPNIIIDCHLVEKGLNAVLLLQAQNDAAGEQ